MTRQQFIDGFHRKMDKASNFAAPGFEIDELEAMATEAMEQLILKKYNYKSNRNQEGFEETEKRISDLSELVSSTTLTPASNTSENVKYGQFVTLPNTLLTNNGTDYSNVYWFTIFDEATSSELECGSITEYKHPYIVSITHDEYSNVVYNPFRKPTDHRVLKMRVGNRRVELISDGTFTITSYFLRYIRKPQPITLSSSLDAQVCELNDNIHREILDETVRIAFKDTEDNQRLQTENNEITE